MKRQNRSSVKIASDSDSDSISLNSSIEEQHDPETEWGVENVLAESQLAGESEPRYLIHWSGYPMHEWTWEPKECLSDGVLDLWVQRKAAIKRGDSEKFRVKRWVDARRKHLLSMLERRRRRNAKRLREGLPLSNSAQDIRDMIADLDLHETGSDDDESEPDGLFIEPTSPRTKPTKLKSPPPRPSQNLKGSKPPKQKASSTVNAPPRYQGTARKPGTGPPIFSSNPNRVQPPKSPISPPGTGLTARRSKTPHHSRPQGDTLPQPSQPSQPSPSLQPQLPQQPPQLSQPSQPLQRKQSGTFEKTDHFFTKHRTARLAVKRTRAKEDVAPSGPGRLFFAANPGKVLQLKTDFSDKAQDQDAVTAGDPGSAPGLTARRSSLVSKGDDASPDGDLAQRPAKKRKFVRFAEGHEDAPQGEPMQVNTEPVVTTAPPTPVLRAPRVLSSFEEPVKKTIILGPEGSTRIDCVFDRVSHVLSETWFTAFLEIECLCFNKQCQAQDFKNPPLAIMLRQLSAGNVVVESEQQRVLVARAAERLRLGSFGLGLFREKYAILIYPTECEDWDMPGITPPPANGVTGKGVRPLVSFRFLIFEPHPQATPFNTPRGTLLDIDNSKTARAVVMEQFFELDYSALIPSEVADRPGEHHFFLDIPLAKKVQLQCLTHWLRSCNNLCKISVSGLDGHWSYFLSRPAGVIMVHQSMLYNIRRYPRIFGLLSMPRGQYRFWVVRDSPLTPIETPEEENRALKGEGAVRPGQLSVVEIFPQGDVFLVTPSFLLAQPLKAYLFFKLILEKWTNSWPPLQVVVGAEIESLLLGKESAIHGQGAADASQEGDKIWQLIRKLSSMTRHMQEENEQQLVPLIWADRAIDSSDEQSLVNWFGWWSLSQLGRFRRFHVVGSEESQQPVTAVVRIPKYAVGAVNAPDALPLYTSAFGGVRRPVRIISDRPDYLRAQLHDRAVRAKEQRHFCPMLIYNKPVSYYDLKQADQLGDTLVHFEIYSHWFKYVKPRTALGGGYNTYAGLFYTPPDCNDGLPGDWSIGGGDQQLQQRQRQAWLAMYRFVEHRLKSGVQLLIWDSAARDRFANEAEGCVITEGDLTEAQRRLVELVRKETPEKFPGEKIPGVQIWLGGFQQPSERVHPLDAVFAFLDSAIRDIRLFLPLSNNHLENRGWRLVRPGAPPRRLSMSLESGGNQMAINGGGCNSNMTISSMATNFDATQHEGQQQVHAKIIFHPPRGNGVIHPSRCVNELYERVVEARQQPHRGGGDTASVRFTYKPTLEWYLLQQKAEGRHFEHINVDVYDRIISFLPAPGNPNI